MSWAGKIIGGTFGFILGGPLGAMLGAALGHNVDRQIAAGPEPGIYPGGQDSVQSAFYTATFAVMGHICKADGRISDAEIILARKVMARMDLSEVQKKVAMQLFNEAKRPDFPLDQVLLQFLREIRGDPTLVRMFMEIQLAAAFTDAELNEREQRLLLHLSDRLGIPRFEYRRLEAMARAEAGYRSRTETVVQLRRGLEEAYALLQVSPKANDEEVKRAYRRLLSQHHPDKLVSKGLPEQMLKMATQKTREIRDAYKRIREARGF